MAAGWLEGYWDLRVAPWDHAAGALLVTEAGGQVTIRPRGDGSRGEAAILASNRRLHASLAALVDWD